MMAETLNAVEEIAFESTLSPSNAASASTCMLIISFGEYEQVNRRLWFSLDIFFM